jgi:16S rRNA (cytosine1402-N4)-methyltransferase
MTYAEFNHLAVLPDELIHSLNLPHCEVVMDCTAGGGGHLAMVMNSLRPNALAIGIDRDPDAIRHLRIKFESAISSSRLQLIKSPFSSIRKIADEFGLIGKISAIYADLGVSSHQLDRAERGFSFGADGPLDMRMSYDSAIPTAAEILNTRSESEIADILFYFGEIRESRRLAKRIVEYRTKSAPFERTLQLVEVSCSVLGPKRFGHSHPATRVFQALRIAVNSELDEAKQLLDDGFNVLASGGRMAIITFHSLEDRLVKQKFGELAGKNQFAHLPRELALLLQPKEALAQIIKPFPICPSEQEISQNPRARSAKLRVIQKA